MTDRCASSHTMQPDPDQELENELLCGRMARIREKRLVLSGGGWPTKHASRFSAVCQSVRLWLHVETRVNRSAPNRTTVPRRELSWQSFMPWRTRRPPRRQRRLPGAKQRRTVK